MFDYGECSEAVHFQFVNPVGIVERRGTALQRHELEIGIHVEAIRIAGCGPFPGQSLSLVLTVVLRRSNIPSSTKYADRAVALGRKFSQPRSLERSAQ